MKKMLAILTTLVLISVPPGSLVLAREKPSPAGGAYAEFNGKDSFLALEDGKLMGTKFEDITVEAWIYLRSLPKEQERWVVAAKPGSFELLVVGPDSGHRRLFAYSFMLRTVDPDDPNCQGEGGHTHGRIDRPTKWHHLSCSFDSSSGLCRLSIDGSVLEGAFWLKTLADTSSLFYIGGMGEELIMTEALLPEEKEVTNSHFDGFIDEVRISDVVRYEDDFEPPEGHLEADRNTLALWHFDREEGVFTDSSSNGNTLTGRSVGFHPVELAGKLSATWGEIKSNY